MRLWLRLLSSLVLAIGLPGPARAAAELSTLQPAEIMALQKRLADGACYSGPIDGQPGAATADAVKACPDQDPVLRIETGMHTALIRRIGVDRECHLMVTGSDDKTVRLWSLPDGRLQKVIRLPIGPGTGGRIDAAAMSPDGRFLAVGGYDAAAYKDMGIGVYLIDLSSNKIRRIVISDEVIDNIAISADGARVALNLGATGIRVLDAAAGRELMADRDFSEGSYGAAFAPDGSLYVAGEDGYLRSYGPDMTRRAKVKSPNGLAPFGIAVDPAGRRVAVGYYGRAAFLIYDAQTLKFLGDADTRDLNNGDFGSLAWTADGRQVIAGGRAQLKFNGKWLSFLRRFDPNGRRLGDTPVSNSMVFNVQACGDRIAFAGAEPSLGLMDRDGRALILQSPTTGDMRMKVGDALAISTDGSSVRFGLGYQAAQPVMFDLLAGTLVDEPGMPAGLTPAKVDGLPITDWGDNTDPKFNGRPIELSKYEISRSFAVRPDQTGFALGADWSLRAFDGAGRQLWRRPVPGTTFGVNLTRDGSIIVAVHDDGTIRWYRWTDGQELLALFINGKTRGWVAWTPSGYYMASPGAEDMIGWHVNRGWEQEADFFPASRFRDKFNRPDIVRAVLQTLDEREAVKQANAAAGRHDDQKSIIERLPPVITILSPSDGSTVAPGMVEVRYSTRMPSGGAVDRVEAFVNGAKIEARGLGPASPSPDGSAIVTLPMPDHDAEISLVAYADGKASDAARVRLKRTIVASSGAPAAEDDALKPTLYALLIGVTHYETKSYDLAYPAQDALGLADALKSQKGKLYKDVVVKVLTDQEATTTAVKRGLSWLRKETTAHDLAIVFAAGHGTTDAKGKFWFLTYDMDPDDVGATAVSRDDISDVLFDLPGKKLLFLDACHSGAALNAGARGESDVSLAISDFAQTEGGVVAYAASTGREFSFENEQWGHGAFTKALIEGFGGGADLLHKGTITTATLDLFLENRVKELTNGRQHPVMTRPTTVPDFPIASVR